jgi:hypothetical protein
MEKILIDVQSLKEEIQKLKESQKIIETGDWSNKLNKNLWEHELGWLDMQMEIEIIERIISAQ